MYNSKNFFFEFKFFLSSTNPNKNIEDKVIKKYPFKNESSNLNIMEKK